MNLSYKECCNYRGAGLDFGTKNIGKYLIMICMSWSWTKNIHRAMAVFKDNYFSSYCYQWKMNIIVAVHYQNTENAQEFDPFLPNSKRSLTS